MAELPDLTVFANILNHRFKGMVLEVLEVSYAKKINVSGRQLKASLENRELLKVIREGKTLQLHFSGDQVLGLHLMLRGELLDYDKDEPPKFQILGFHFEGGEGFSLIDLQKQATPTLNPGQSEVPDAQEIAQKTFLEVLKAKRMRIKSLLMDQRVLRGIGNSYADEILYEAGISPFSIARAIPEKQIQILFSSMRKVLRTAIDRITTANGIQLGGELKDFMQIHSTRLKVTKKGETIKSEKIGGRKTYYTAAQELYS